MKTEILTPYYVDEIPEDLEEGKLYISKKYGVAVHKCACGCGGKTVTPFKYPNNWVLIEMDGFVSLTPSIGNWSGENPYHAHYYITDNKIEWL